MSHDMRLPRNTTLAKKGSGVTQFLFTQTSVFGRDLQTTPIPIETGLGYIGLKLPFLLGLLLNRISDLPAPNDKAKIGPKNVPVGIAF